MTHRFKLALSTSLSVFALSISNSFAKEADYFDMPLHELMDIEVTSVSKRSEKATNAPAAIFVITEEEIRRSGHTSVPEILRMAPGVHVAQIDSNKWAITSRGFGKQFSNKLLVLIDGRSVYTPTFSGVYWDQQDVVLDDIDRIEVIRGPGATLWGANAVNGVINIITKSASKTQGGIVTAGYGNYEEGFASTRYGFELSEHSDARIYAKLRNKGEFENKDGNDAQDDWSSAQAGFRIDSNISNNSITFQGDLQYSEKNQYATSLPIFSSPFATATEVDDRGKAWNLLTRWNQKQSARSTTTLQAYLDYYSRDSLVLNRSVTTIDFDFQHQYDLNPQNQLVWGSGLRHISYNIPSTQYFIYDDSRRVDMIYSAFLQNKTAIIPDTLFVTLGSKFEHNDYTGFEYQPSAKTSWNINDKNTAWASVSRAVRTPSRNEDEVNYIVDAIPPGTLLGPGTPPAYVSFFGSSDVESEEMIAYELGYRSQITNALSIDVATFFNDYKNIRTNDAFGTPFVETRTPIPYLTLPSRLNNNIAAEAYGIEISSNWQINNQWRLTGNYSLTKINLKPMGNASPSLAVSQAGRYPEHMASLRSLYSLSENLEWDNSLYYSDNLAGTDVRNYIRFDTRIGWKLNDRLSLDVVGQNLFDDAHLEFDEQLYGVTSQIGRSIYGKVIYRF